MLVNFSDFSPCQNSVHILLQYYTSGTLFDEHVPQGKSDKIYNNLNCFSEEKNKLFVYY